MRFTKIKWNGKKANLEWTVPNGEDQEERALRNCPDQPAQAFEDALEAIAAHIPRLIGARKDYADSGFLCTGVTLGEDPTSKRRTFIFHCRKDVPATGGAFNFTVPRILARDPDAEGEQDKLLPEEAESAVDRLIAEAKGYVEGQREQGELDLGQGGGSAMAQEDDEEEDTEEDENRDQGPQYRVGEVPEDGSEDLEEAAEDMAVEARRGEMAAVE